jgi:predicted flap endonuclease-1-like 5' DNA nuclease
MKRRILGFLLGAILGFIAAYLTRRILKDQQPEPALPLPESLSKAEKSNQVAPAKKSESSANGQYSINAAADGSQAEVTPGEKITRSTEPPAATETDSAATSSRAETFEPIEVPLAKVDTAEPETAKKSGEVEETLTPEPTEAGEDSETDFTVIVGVGEVFNRKLHDGGINTFEGLIMLTPEEIADRTGIPQDRIERDNWVGQVKDLLKQGTPPKTRKAVSVNDGSTESAE